MGVKPFLAGLSEVVTGAVYNFLVAPTFGSFFGFIPVAAVVLLWSSCDILFSCVSLHRRSEAHYLFSSFVIFVGCLGVISSCFLRGRRKYSGHLATSVFLGQTIAAFSRIVVMCTWLFECFIGTCFYPEVWEETFEMQMTRLYGESLQETLGLFYDPIGSVLTLLMHAAVLALVCWFGIELYRSYFRIVVEMRGSGWEGLSAEDIVSPGSSMGGSKVFADFLLWLQPEKTAFLQKTPSSSTPLMANVPSNDPGRLEPHHEGCGGDGTSPSSSQYHTGTRQLAPGDYELDPADRPGNRILHQRAAKSAATAAASRNSSVGSVGGVREAGGEGWADGGASMAEFVQLLVDMIQQGVGAEEIESNLTSSGIPLEMVRACLVKALQINRRLGSGGFDDYWDRETGRDVTVDSGTASSVAVLHSNSGSGNGIGGGIGTGTGVGTGIGTGVGTGIGTGVGGGVGTGIGTGVGTGVGTGIGTGVGTGIGTGVGAGAVIGRQGSQEGTAASADHGIGEGVWKRTYSSGGRRLGAGRSDAAAMEAQALRRVQSVDEKRGDSQKKPTSAAAGRGRGHKIHSSIALPTRAPPRSANGAVGGSEEMPIGETVL